MKSTMSARFSAPLVRRDLIAILAYVNHGGAAAKCVDGTFGGAEARLNRLAAAAGMQ
jgi:hypothetical protein